MNTRDSFVAPATYFLQEGKENLRECLKASFTAARQQNIKRIVIFTSFGEGVRIALEEFSSQEEYGGIDLVAVTFPYGKRFTREDGTSLDVDISPENRTLFERAGIPIVRAHLPFDPIAPSAVPGSTPARDFNQVGDALNMFCGSMALCVQAATIACDAGAVKIGEHVIAMTSDTSILAEATCTRRMLCDFIIREIICKPVILTIGRKETSERVSILTDPLTIPSPTTEPLPPTPPPTAQQKRLPEKPRKKR